MKVKRIVIVCLVLCLVLIPFNAKAAMTSSYSPYASIEYGYSSTVNCGTIRYISQSTGDSYFNWSYWPAKAFGSYSNPGTECGTASISMALSYIGINETPKAMLEKYDGVTQFIGWDGSTHTWESSIGSAMDKYINGKGKYSPPVIHISKYSSLGHYVVVIGKISDTSYQILDPAARAVTIMNISGNSATYTKGGSTIYDTIDQIHQWYNPNAVYNGGDVQRVPVGAYDIANGGENSVFVRGWAYDPDNVGQAVSIHVYIDGSYAGDLTADTFRSDVNNVYGCGDYHGFAGNISYEVTKPEEHSVEIYALDLTYGGAQATYLGSKTVTITPDAQPPVITDVTVSNVSSSGYTITCTVKDNYGLQKVQFPTWTWKNGQDDLVWEWRTDYSCSGVIEGNKVTYRVDASEHNYEEGLYYTHIYAIDTFGNETKSYVMASVGDNIFTPVKTIEYGDHKYEMYIFSSEYANPLGWSAAKTYAESMGGHLVTFESGEEWEFVKSEFYTDTQGYWLGATDEVSEGNWKWVTGEDMTFTAWSSGQPDNNSGTGVQNYMAVRVSDLLWDDEMNVNSAVNYGFICEFDAEHEHDYTGRITLEATCTTNGLMKYTCSCGDYYTEIITAKGHDYREGYCSVCGIKVPDVHLPGDINGDGDVNNKDLTRLFQYLSDWDVEVVNEALDVNGDGIVNNKDQTRLFQYLSDWDVAIY